METFEVADLFCGAGGSSSGAEKAIEELGHTRATKTIEKGSYENSSQAL